MNYFIGREDLINFWLKFCSRISNKEDEDRKKFYVQKFKNFLLELGLKLIDSFKYTVPELMSINTMATKKKEKQDKEEDGDDEEHDKEEEEDSYDENDEMQREINHNKQFIYYKEEYL